MTPDDILQHLNPGDRIRAPLMNAIIDCVRREMLTDDCVTDSNGVRRRRKIPAQYTQIFIVNATGSDRKVGEVLSPYQEFYDPTDAAEIDSYVWLPTLKGRVPTSDDVGNVCVLLEDCDAGERARACISGPCAVRLKPLMVSGIDTQYADIDVGDATHLKESRAGCARVLSYTTGDSSDKWALVSLGTGFGGYLHCRGLTTGAVAKSTGTFTVNTIVVVGIGVASAPAFNASETMIILNWANWESKASYRCDFAVTDFTAASGSIGHGDFLQGACKADQP